jgi:hypothetical protein
MQRLIVVLCLALVGWSGAGLAADPALAASLCVGSGPGCYPTLQQALDKADNGDVIHIEPGTYSGSTPSPIVITKSVQIIGAGAALTTIKGGGPVVTIGQSGASTEPTVSLKGVTITGGLNASYPDTVHAFGGGIAVPPAANDGIGATVTITDSVITDNAAVPSASLPRPERCPTCRVAIGRGGGIWTEGAMTLTNTVVSNNRAGDMPGLPANASDADGGGILEGNGASLTLNNSVVTGNHALATTPNGRFANSGGIFAFPGATLTLDGSTVSNNTADLSAAITTAGPTGTGIAAVSGGIHVAQDFSSGLLATATIRNSTITGNEVSATNQSGDAVAFSGGIDADGSLVLRDSTVSNNRVTATTTFVGSSPGNAFTDSGALEIEGPATISNTKFIGNSVTATSTAGLAFANPGGVGATPSQPMTISDSVISGNSASAASTTGQAVVQGGGLLVFAVVTLRNTTVSHNTGTATGPSGVAQGGGIWNGNFFPGASSTLTLIDSAITDNSLSTSPGIQLQGGGLYNGTGATVTLTNTMITRNTPDNCYPPNTIAGCSG